MISISRFFASLTVAVLIGIAASTGVVAGGHGITGAFVGDNDHVTSGSVEIVKAGSGYKVILGDDFSLDGGPDPKLGFGNGSDFASETMFSKLKKLTGKQEYMLPADLDPTEFDTFYIWCDKFSVSLGHAKLR